MVLALVGDSTTTKAAPLAVVGLLSAVGFRWVTDLRLLAGFGLATDLRLPVGFRLVAGLCLATDFRLVVDFFVFLFCGAIYS
jgi:hypothetical protein